jgi:hypothetical protein
VKISLKHVNLALLNEQTRHHILTYVTYAGKGHFKNRFEIGALAEVGQEVGQCLIRGSFVSSHWLYNNKKTINVTGVNIFNNIPKLQSSWLHNGDVLCFLSGTN